MIPIRSLRDPNNQFHSRLVRKSRLGIQVRRTLRDGTQTCRQRRQTHRRSSYNFDLSRSTSAASLPLWQRRDAPSGVRVFVRCFWLAAIAPHARQHFCSRVGGRWSWLESVLARFSCYRCVPCSSRARPGDVPFASPSYFSAAVSLFPLDE